MAWHDVTQADLGRIMGCSQQAVGHKIKGIRKFTVDELVAIAEAFGIEAGNLLTPPPLDDLLGPVHIPAGALLRSTNSQQGWSEAISGHCVKTVHRYGLTAYDTGELLTVDLQAA